MSDCIFIFYYCHFYYSGSKPTRLFNEREVGEEIPAGVPTEKAELDKDQSVAGSSTEAKSQNVTPGNQTTALNPRMMNAAAAAMTFHSLPPFRESRLPVQKLW